MQLEELKVYCDVVLHRSFSAAAQRNGLTQSAVSRIISRLERRIGLRLIDRSTRPLEVTPAGQRFYQGCSQLIDDYTDLLASLRDGGDPSVPRVLQLAAIYSVAYRDMSWYVARFRALRPDAEVHIEYLHPHRVYERVLDGTAELGIVSFARTNRQVVAVPWRQERMVVACPPEHQFAQLESVRPQMLDGQQFVAFDSDLAIRRHVDRFLRAHGANVVVELEFDNVENVKKAVEEGAGVALLPLPTLKREIAAGTIVAIPLQEAELVRELYIIHRRHGQLSHAAKLLLKVLTEREEAKPQESAGGSGRRQSNGTDTVTEAAQAMRITESALEAERGGSL